MVDAKRSLDTYGSVARNYLSALDRIESFLEAQSHGALVSRVDLARAAGVHGTSEDVVLLIAESLSRAGILQAHGSTLSVDTRRLADTKSFRDGVRVGLGAVPQSAGDVVLLARAPTGASDEVRKAVETYAGDLRFEILDLIASAREELLLASPFWDSETARDLHQPLAGRLATGVRVVLLAREPSGPARALWESLCMSSDKCFLYHWYEFEREQADAATFHLKALVQDGGRAAYIGSANFTASSLRSRMELGLRITGAPARALTEIMRAVIAGARLAS